MKENCNNVYNYFFEDKEEAEKYSKFETAQRKLYLISKKLNGDGSPWDHKKFYVLTNKRVEGVEFRIAAAFRTNTFFFTGVPFKDHKKAEKAIEMMGEDSLKDYFMFMEN
jgi:hypothetical protein